MWYEKTRSLYDGEIKYSVTSDSSYADDCLLIEGYSGVTIDVSTNYPSYAYDVRFSVTDNNSYTQNGTLCHISPVISDGDGQIMVYIYATNKEDGTESQSSIKFDVLEYEPVQVTCTAIRSDSTSTDITLSLSVKSTLLNNYNDIESFTIRCENTGEEKTYSSAVETVTFSDISEDEIPTFTITVTDKFSTASYKFYGEAGDVTIDFYHTGKGVSFGKVATQEGFEVNWDSHFNGAMDVDGAATFYDGATVNCGLRGENFCVYKDKPTSTTESNYANSEKKFAGMKFSNYDSSSNKWVGIGSYDDENLYLKRYVSGSGFKTEKILTEENLDTSNEDSGWIDLTLTDSFERYSTENVSLQVRKIGKIVHLRGVIKPTENITPENDSDTLVAMFPSKWKPAYREVFICQGSGAHRFALSIDTMNVLGFEYGAVIISRYTDTNTMNETIPLGAWLNCFATWFVD